MDLHEYQKFVGELGFGKRLPTAVYVFRGDQVSLGEGVDRLLAQIVAAFQVGPEFNVIKFRTDELKVSFLSYPRFFEDPHPALRHAITIELVRGKARHTDYTDNLNPPILHRKEAFLPADHPKRRLFTALTEAEEAAGLYANTTTIGFKLNWERLVDSKRLRYGGHRLLAAEDGAGANQERHLTPALSPDEAEREAPVVVDRHKIALVRYELSKPVRTLLEYGQLKSGDRGALSLPAHSAGRGSGDGVPAALGRVEHQKSDTAFVPVCVGGTGFEVRVSGAVCATGAGAQFQGGASRLLETRRGHGAISGWLGEAVETEFAGDGKAEGGATRLSGARGGCRFGGAGVGGRGCRADVRPAERAGVDNFKNRPAHWH